MASEGLGPTLQTKPPEQPEAEKPEESQSELKGTTSVMDSRQSKLKDIVASFEERYMDKEGQATDVACTCRGAWKWVVQMNRRRRGWTAKLKAEGKIRKSFWERNLYSNSEKEKNNDALHEQAAAMTALPSAVSEASNDQKISSTLHFLANYWHDTSDVAPMYQKIGIGNFVTPRHWGMTKAQLKMFIDLCKASDQWDDEDDIKSFTEKFVRPIWDKRRLSVSLAMNQQDPKEVTVMVSHSWAENARRFFDDLLGNAETSGSLLDHEVLFVCFLCSPQADVQREADGSTQPANNGQHAEMSSTHRRELYREVIRNWHCQRLLVVPCDELKEKGLYSRMWCIWEVREAVERGIPINFTERVDKAPAEEQRHYLLGEQRQSSFFARCSKPDDEVLIRDAITKHRLPCLKTTVKELCIVGGVYAQCELCMGLFIPELTMVWMAVSFFAKLFIAAVAFLAARRKGMHCWGKKRDNYTKLDKIVLASVQRWYSYRRPVLWDIFRVLLISIAGAFAFILGFKAIETVAGQSFRIWVSTLLRVRHDNDVLPQLFFKGGQHGVVLGIATDINILGLVHGQYIKNWSEQKWAGVILVAIYLLGTWGLLLVTKAAVGDGSRYAEQSMVFYWSNIVTTQTDDLAAMVGCAVISRWYGSRWRQSCCILAIVSYTLLGDYLASIAWTKGHITSGDSYIHNAFWFASMAAAGVFIPPWHSKRSRVVAYLISGTIVLTNLFTMILFVSVPHPDQ